MSGFLAEIVMHKRRETAERKDKVPTKLLESRLKLGTHRFCQALSGNGLKLVAEIKPASPSLGTFQQHVDVSRIVHLYNRYASAISVLTDQKYFSGSLELLNQVAASSPHPILCKDFVLDPYQVLEARNAGADAVLLIVKILTAKELSLLKCLVLDLGMTPVIEVQNHSELVCALEVDPSVLLINNRDLNSFAISFDTTRDLAPLIPQSILSISASGIETSEDVAALSPYCSRLLIGSALMKAGNLEQKLQELCR